ncbi:MmcQ/YjbR family DNA-binding protein [Streptomyces sp. NPDC005132]|uniref:MmcQ/YjbR family DNA-binding protein n=1 Tax=Streptomyces sp. NPDC005132 TaxID=3154294 RepID=UPI0033A33957
MCRPIRPLGDLVRCSDSSFQSHPCRWVVFLASGGPGLDVYKVAGRAFLIVAEHPDDQIITVKCEPEHSRALERGHLSITPGLYLDKRHWISPGPGVGITERLITDAVEDSYDLAAERLPRRDRPAAR